jgi:molybdenum cofactor guanylyltransferase
MGGGDKALLTVAGRTMLAHVIARLGPQVDHLILNANGPPARFSDYGLPVAADTIDGHPGPLAGVLAGMRWCEAHHTTSTALVTVSTDAPLIPDDLVARLAAERARTGARIALAQSGGKLHPVIGLWPIELADDLDQALKAGVRKVLDWTDRHSIAKVEFAAVESRGQTYDPFFNANTPDELAELDRFLKAIL